MFGEYFRLKKLDVLANYILFFGISKYFAETHVALIDNSKSLLLTANVYTRCSILSIAIHITILICSGGTVELKVNPQICCLLSLYHLLISSFLIVQDINQVCSI